MNTAPSSDRERRLEKLFSISGITDALVKLVILALPMGGVAGVAYMVSTRDTTQDKVQKTMKWESPLSPKTPQPNRAQGNSPQQKTHNRQHSLQAKSSSPLRPKKKGLPEILKEILKEGLSSDKKKLLEAEKLLPSDVFDDYEKTLQFYKSLVTSLSEGELYLKTFRRAEADDIASALENLRILKKIMQRLGRILHITERIQIKARFASFIQGYVEFGFLDEETAQKYLSLLKADAADIQKYFLATINKLSFSSHEASLANLIRFLQVISSVNAGDLPHNWVSQLSDLVRSNHLPTPEKIMIRDALLDSLSKVLKSEEKLTEFKKLHLSDLPDFASYKKLQALKSFGWNDLDKLKSVPQQLRTLKPHVSSADYESFLKSLAAKLRVMIVNYRKLSASPMGPSEQDLSTVQTFLSGPMRELFSAAGLPPTF